MMSLFIACLVIYGFKLSGFLYAVAIVLWVVHACATTLRALINL